MGMLDAVHRLPGWKRVWVFSLLFLGVVSVIDFYAMELAKKVGLDLSLGSPFMKTYLFSFWSLFLFCLVFFAVIYYFFVHMDKSEAFAVFAVGYVMQIFGVEDLLYYLLRFASMPAHLDYLDSHFIMGGFANLIGSPIVTPFTLMASTAVGLWLSWRLSKFMWQLN